MNDFEQYSKLYNLLISGMNVVRQYTAAAKPNLDQLDIDKKGKGSQPIRDKTMMIDNFVKFAKDKLEVNVLSSDIVDTHTLSKRSSEKETCI